MSITFSVIGFKPPDEKWKQMKAIYDSCEKANVATPKEVDEFFNYDPPSDNGVEVDLSLKKLAEDSEEGYLLKVSDIPKDVTLIKIFESY